MNIEIADATQGLLNVYLDSDDISSESWNVWLNEIAPPSQDELNAALEKCAEWKQRLSA